MSTPSYQTLSDEFLQHISEKLNTKLTHQKPLTGPGVQNQHILVWNDQEEKYVIRIVTSQTVALGWEDTREALVLQALSPHSSHIPRLHFVDCSKTLLKHTFMIMDFYDGKPLGPEDLRVESTISQCAQLLSQFHKEFPPYSELKSNLTQEQIDAIEETSRIKMNGLFVEQLNVEKTFKETSKCMGEEDQTTMTKLIDTIIETTRDQVALIKELKLDNIIHGDPNIGNFFRLKESGLLRLMDFEGCGLGHIVADLGTFLSANALDPHKQCIFLKSYGYESNPKENELLWLFMIQRYVSLIAFLVNFVASGKEMFKNYVKIYVSMLRAHIDRRDAFIENVYNE